MRWNPGISKWLGESERKLYMSQPEILNSRNKTIQPVDGLKYDAHATADLLLSNWAQHAECTLTTLL